MKLEKRFNQNADELRKVDKELKELKVSYERNLQLVEKQNKLQEDYEGILWLIQRKCCSLNSQKEMFGRKKKLRRLKPSSKKKS